MALLQALSALVLALFTMPAAAKDVCGGKDWGSAGVFDFYVLALSWPAEFCATKTYYPGCEEPTAWQQTNFTMHGLWPNYKASVDGHDWPQCCTSKFGSTVTAAEMNPILKDLQTYWPSEQEPDPTSDWSSTLWEHEWARHGTCSGLAVTRYFQHAMSIMLHPELATPSIVTDNIGSTVDPQQLLAYFTKNKGCQDDGSCLAGLSCSNYRGSQYLTGVTTCWTKDGQRFVCPAEVLGTASCTDDQIVIESFNNAQVRAKEHQAKKNKIILNLP